jgi:phage tail-like protein
MAAPAPPPDSPKDLTHPLPGFAFHVNLYQVGSLETNAHMYFKSVSGLKFETETMPVQAGGSNDRTFNLVGATKWANIVLKRGFAKGGNALLQLRNDWMFRPTKQRIGGKITQLDTNLQVVTSWTFHRGWPVKWELSDLDASKSEISVETIEIAHDGLTLG